MKKTSCSIGLLYNVDDIEGGDLDKMYAGGGVPEK